MYILLTGLSHKTAPIDIRERCAFSTTVQHDMYRKLMRSDIISGAILLVTCNRTELYATAHDVRLGLAALENVLQSYSGMKRAGFAQYLYQYFSYHAIGHLFAVTAGLESMILGEHQVMGQVKNAYQGAVDAGASNSILNMLMQTALHVGKKVRTRTGISKYPVSVSSAAVELCREIFGSLEHRQVLILGAGDTSELAAKHLLSQGAQSVIVANRSYDHAVAMATAVSGKAIHFDAMPQQLQHTDIIISCTAAPHFVIRRDNCEQFLRARGGREIVMIDIAVPRDIEPELEQIDNVFLYDIDDLQNVVEANYKERLKAAHKAREIIDQETVVFTEKLATLSLVPVIQSLKKHAESVKQEELTKALRKLNGSSERETKIVRALAHGLINKILHAPLAKLKEKAVNDQGHLYADIVKDLFDLDITSRDLPSDAHPKAGNKRK